tara:strand:- start:1393 stop:1569 length:177 start_codon:yes stop_codon:yes gene_type:complete
MENKNKKTTREIVDNKFEKELKKTLTQKEELKEVPNSVVSNIASCINHFDKLYLVNKR